PQAAKRPQSTAKNTGTPWMYTSGAKGVPFETPSRLYESINLSHLLDRKCFVATACTQSMSAKP
ncbi:hypothetical protein, partial [Pseudomonas syringae]|uniref:hypothetical protein n=1 Tax=Pseudomonas syringae TaxID=317 RepID=UPI001967D53A